MKPTISNRKCRKCGTTTTMFWVDRDYCTECVPDGRVYMATITAHLYGSGYIARAVRMGVSASSTCSALVAAERCAEKLIEKFPGHGIDWTLTEEPVEELNHFRYVLTEKAPS